MALGTMSDRTRGSATEICIRVRYCASMASKRVLCGDREGKGEGSAPTPTQSPAVQQHWSILPHPLPYQVNAIAVLHEERFLKNIGWGTDQGIGGFGEEPGIKSQLMNLIRSVRTVMRVPLIIVNSIAIVLLLLFG